MNPPNILLILIDDLGWTDLTCYGSGFYETPNLDRLASQGMLFTDAYSSSPVCSPTRASILSGKYPARVGVTQYIPGHTVGRLQDVPYFHALPASEYSIASALRDGGYQTWHVGKWHLGGSETSPEQHGFTENIAGFGWGMPHCGFFSPYGMENLSDGPDGEYLTDRLTTDAIELINSRDQGRPFFLNLAHYAVHIPIEAPADLTEKYRRKAHDLGLDKEDVIVIGEPFGCQHLRGERVMRRTKQSDPAYAAMIENLDTNIGRVMQCLEENYLSEDTLVLFTSDNGGLATSNPDEGVPTSNKPLAEGKGWMYEGGTRVCQIASWPGQIEAGSVCDQPVTSTDLYPTFLEAARLPLNPEQHRDGISLMQLMIEGSSLERDAIFWHYPHYANQGGRPAGSVRSGDWKLIKHFEDGRLELFNLRDDEGEMHDMSEAEPDVTRRLTVLLNDWQKAVEALIPKHNSNYRAAALEPGVDAADV
jgi:arylsulfatase A-like enzyme